MKNRTLNFILLFLIINTLHLSANLQITVKPDTDKPAYNVNSYNPPYTYTMVKATYNNVPIKLESNNFLIIENGFALKIHDIKDTLDGWQRISWYSKLSSNRGIFQYAATLFAHKDGDFTEINLRGWVNVQAGLGVVDHNQETLREINFGYYPVGNKIPRQIRIFGEQQHYVKGIGTPEDPIIYNEKQLFIDSITTQTDIFTYTWLGSDSDFQSKPPPSSIKPGSRYWINIYFEPKANIYYSDVLTIHFHNGMKTRIPLSGNNYTLNFDGQLKLIQPNGGENFAPCEQVLIKWKGHSPHLPVLIDFSSNSGANWSNIASVRDSQYVWTVPANITSTAKIQVRQEFDRSERRLLNDDSYPFRAVNFSADGNFLLAVNNRGRFLNWDLYSQNQPFISHSGYIDENINYPSTNFDVYDAVYTGANNKYAVCFRQPGNTTWRIAFINNSSQFPYDVLQLPQGFRANSMDIDRFGNHIAVTAQRNSQVLIISTATEQVIRTLNFDYPVTNFEYNKNLDQAYVVLLNGDFITLGTPNYNEIDKKDFSDFPLPSSIKVSPNGKLLGLGTEYTQYDTYKTNYLIELESENTVGVYRQGGSSTVGMGFSGASTAFWLATEYTPQIKMYDLTHLNGNYTIEGHIGRLTALKINPNSTAMVSTAESSENLYFRTFSTPESDQSKNNFSIRRPKIHIENYNFGSEYMGIENVQTVEICNRDLVMLNVDKVSLKYGTHFKIIDAQNKFTLDLNDCISLDIQFMPLDTGNIVDTLFLRTCNYEIALELKGYGIPRTVSYNISQYDFGEVCVGDILVTEPFLILRNEDPVPLTIIGYRIDDEPSIFDLASAKADTVLQRGETYKVALSFSPNDIRTYNGVFVIHHSKQYKHVFKLPLKGEGIGTFAEISHNPLYFIPEQLEREITIFNTGNTDITIENFALDKPDAYEVLTNTPILVPKSGNIKIRIRAKDLSAGIAKLRIEGEPCVISKTIELAPYAGTISITLPTINADAKKEVAIPLEYKLSAVGDYNGELTFEATFEVNPRLFMPTSIESSWGNAEIISATVENGLRKVKFRVIGEVPNEGIIATIKGLPGLAEINKTPLTWVQSSFYFGTALNYNINNGELIIDVHSNDRLIYRESQNLVITSIAPNPTSDILNMNFTSETDGVSEIIVFNSLGLKVMQITEFAIQKGSNNLNLNLSLLPTGNYSIKIKNNGDATSASFVISR